MSLSRRRDWALTRLLCGGFLALAACGRPPVPRSSTGKPPVVDSIPEMRAWDVKRTGDAMTGDSSTVASLASDSVLKGHSAHAMALLVVRCSGRNDLQAGFVVSEPPLPSSGESVEAIIRFGDELVTDWDWWEQQVNTAYWVGVYGMYTNDMVKKLSPGARVLFRYTSLWHDQLTFGFALPADTRAVVDQVRGACHSKRRR